MSLPPQGFGVGAAQPIIKGIRRLFDEETLVLDSEMPLPESATTPTIVAEIILDADYLLDNIYVWIINPFHLRHNGPDTPGSWHLTVYIMVADIKVYEYNDGYWLPYVGQETRIRYVDSPGASVKVVGQKGERLRAEFYVTGSPGGEVVLLPDIQPKVRLMATGYLI